MNRIYAALALPLALVSVPAFAQQAEPLDDLDCSVRMMKVLAGTLKELKKNDLSAEDRGITERFRFRSERALAYYMGRLDQAGRSADFRKEISARWTTMSALDLDAQTDQSTQCLKRADDAQIAFLTAARG